MSDKIELMRGDITTLSVDAIVNAANNRLIGGGGVDGAIHRAGGEQISQECAAIRRESGGCKTGEAVITRGGFLPCKYVIHTVGPVWHGGSKGEEALLRSCYNSSLHLAKDHNIKSIAFPNISTGVYGYPKKEAAKAAIDEVKRFLQGDPSIERVIFVSFDEENYDLYKKLLDKE